MLGSGLPLRRQCYRPELIGSVDDDLACKRSRLTQCLWDHVPGNGEHDNLAEVNCFERAPGLCFASEFASEIRHSMRVPGKAEHDFVLDLQDKTPRAITANVPRPDNPNPHDPS